MRFPPPPVLEKLYHVVYSSCEGIMAWWTLERSMEHSSSQRRAEGSNNFSWEITITGFKNNEARHEQRRVHEYCKKGKKILLKEPLYQIEQSIF